MLIVHRLRETNALARFRLATLAFACYTALEGAFGTTDRFGAAMETATLAGALLLIGLYVVTFVAIRPLPWEPVVLAVLVVVTAAGQDDPEQAIELALGALAIMPLHSRPRFAVTRLGLVLTAYVMCSVVSPAARELGMTWHSEDVVNPLPTLAMVGALITVVHMLLSREQQAAARESLLAQTGQRLINLANVTEVRATLGDALAEVCEEWDRRTALVVRFAPAGVAEPAADAVVELAVAGELVGRSLPWPSGIEAEWSAVDWPARAELAAVTGDDRAWWAVRFDDGDLGVLVSGPAVPAALGVALRTLVTQWSLAERNCRNHADLARGAESDHLTELPNRRLFLRELAAIGGDSAGDTVLLLIDLDDFKQVNDGYGHPAGDGLLVEIAARIARAAGSSGVAARLGGDEFALLLTGVPSAEAADHAAGALREDLLRPVSLPEATVSVGASIGLAVAEPHLTAGDLMRCADIAMYSAKAHGKNRVERFSEAKHGSVARIRRIEEHLAHAVERGEVSVWYQPRVDLHTDRVCGLEAGARWHDGVMGQVPAAVFLPMAARTGHLKGIGRHVLTSACVQLAAWRGQGDLDLTVSVSVAPVQLYDPAFVTTVRECLAETGTPADRLVLEIAQDQATDLERAGEAITELAAIGVRIALDDFVATHAALAGLFAFPVHQIKVGCAIALDESGNSRAMVQILALGAQMLGYELVAAGVEADDPVEAIRAAGFRTAQGSRYADPMPASEMATWLAERKALGAER